MRAHFPVLATFQRARFLATGIFRVGFRSIAPSFRGGFSLRTDVLLIPAIRHNISARGVLTMVAVGLDASF